MSSITLTPLNGNVLPSNVSVTPIYNGVTQAIKTCVVSRAPFNTSTLLISGNNYVCDTGIYSINNLPSSVVIQSVTSSNNNIDKYEEIELNNSIFDDNLDEEYIA